MYLNGKHKSTQSVAIFSTKQIDESQDYNHRIHDLLFIAGHPRGFHGVIPLRERSRWSERFFSIELEFSEGMNFFIFVKMFPLAVCGSSGPLFGPIPF